jgi:alpha-D-ribose 1-methylphosphonate 5-triphosphate synthase subunit PhnG
MTVQLDQNVSMARRKRWVSLLAKADHASLRRLVDNWGIAPEYERLRGPEAGLVMLRGRAGGTGEAFNLGEMTVTRCSVRLSDGTLGHAYVGGRDPEHCETAAWLDALLQTPAYQDDLLSGVIEPLEREADERRTLAARKTAATRVEFFTMSTGR